MTIRPARPEDRDVLLDLWLRSVRATHAFLTEADIQTLLPAVRDQALPALERGHATLTVDVNEQNPGALRFYEAGGFAVTGRSPVDSAGRPYPLLHLRESVR